MPKTTIKITVETDGTCSDVTVPSDPGAPCVPTVEEAQAVVAELALTFGDYVLCVQGSEQDDALDAAGFGIVETLPNGIVRRRY